MVQHTTPVDELAAVNILLSTIGEPPINTLTGDGSPSVSASRSILGEISRAVQAQGWNFNREYDVPFNPDVNGEIAVPSDVLGIEVKNAKYGIRDVIRRGAKLYDRGNRTFVFTMPLWADVIYLRDFEELTESARYYIAIRAARTLSNRVAPSKVVYQFTREDETMARANFLSEDGDTGNFSMLDNSPVARVFAARTGRWTR